MPFSQGSIGATQSLDALRTSRRHCSRRMVAFLTKASYQSPADYVLAVYVMLSRARKLEDLFIVDMPDRDIFEGALRRLNPTLVARMEELQRMSAESLRGAKKDAAWLKWSISNQ